MEDNLNKAKQTKRLLIIFLSLSLAANVLLLILYINKQSVVEKTESKLTYAENIREELEAELEEYEDLVAQNNEEIFRKDSLLSEKDKEIEVQVQKIRKILAQKNITKAEYLKAKDEIKKLKYYIEKYQNQINVLQKENRELLAENSGLREDKKEMSRHMDELEDKNASLSNKVIMGSRLMTEDFYTTGIYFKKSGKVKETTRYKKTEGINICLRLKDNDMAEEGKRIFHVKIIKPNGEPFFDQNQGGEINLKNGEKTLYTFKTLITFKKRNNKKECFTWQNRKIPFTKGIYNISIYTEGYLVCKQKITLK